MLNMIKAGRGKRLFLLFTKHPARDFELQEKQNPWSKLVLAILLLLITTTIMGTLIAFFRNDLQ